MDEVLACIDPRAGTNFVLGPLSEGLLISRGIVVDGQYVNGKDMGHLGSKNIIDL